MQSPQTSEMIGLSDAVPAWKALPNLNQPRAHQVNTVLMPDSRVFLAGGIPNTGGPAEIWTPRIWPRDGFRARS
jgi:hypothetical protein